MGTNTQSDADAPDTNTRIDATSSAVDQSADTTPSVTTILAATNGSSEQSCCFDVGSDGTDDLERFVSDVATIAQSHCKRATDYTDIETLVYQLPIDHCTFGAHDASAPYS